MDLTRSGSTGTDISIARYQSTILYHRHAQGQRPVRKVNKDLVQVKHKAKGKTNNPPLYDMYMEMISSSASDSSCWRSAV